MSLLQTLKEEQKALLSGKEDKKAKNFRPGDLLKVGVRIKEGKRERIQIFEGLCLGRRNRGLHSTFTVRKLSSGVGVERVFPLYGPLIDSLAIVRKGAVRQAKLYYMRKLRGKAARIKERR